MQTWHRRQLRSGLRRSEGFSGVGRFALNHGAGARGETGRRSACFMMHKDRGNLKLSRTTRGRRLSDSPPTFAHTTLPSVRTFRHTVASSRLARSATCNAARRCDTKSRRRRTPIHAWVSLAAGTRPPLRTGARNRGAWSGTPDPHDRDHTEGNVSLQLCTLRTSRGNCGCIPASSGSSHHRPLPSFCLAKGWYKVVVPGTRDTTPSCHTVRHSGCPHNPGASGDIQ